MDQMYPLQETTEAEAKKIEFFNLDAPIHMCPPNGSGVTPCCGKTPFEVLGTDRMTLERANVTCEVS